MAKQDPEDPVQGREKWPGIRSLQYKDLLAQGEVLDDQFTARANEVAQEFEDDVWHE